MILVTAKVNPDLDGTACLLAYSSLLNQTGQPAEGWVFGQPQSEVDYFIKKLGINIPTKQETGQGTWGKFVLVDASSMKGMPKVVRAKDVIEIIDHRTSEPEKEFPNAKIQNEPIGAAATIVVERFIKTGRKPLPDHAVLLYGAIYHNTLNFTSSNTTERDRKAANFLGQKFHLTAELTSEMFSFATHEILSDVERAIRNDAKEFGRGYKIQAYQLIGYNLNLDSQKDRIEEILVRLDKEFEAEWSLLNIVDLKTRTSTIYVSDRGKMTLLQKALGYPFKFQWTTLPVVFLRKQIMPKIQAVLENGSL